MNRAFIYLAIMAFAFGGCRKDPETQKREPGYFRLIQIRDPLYKSTGQVVEDSVKTAFDLGDIKASKEFYFILSNGGENAIFDIHLGTDNSQVEVTPQHISNLRGTTGSMDEDFIPLISLGIIHGRQLNGVGFADLLPMGTSTCKLTITGKTIENGDTVELQSAFDFSFLARIMDIRLYSDEQEVDLLKPTGNAALPVNFGGLGFIPYYQRLPGQIRLQNNGNVDISVHVYELDDFGKISNDFDTPLPVDEFADIQATQRWIVFSLNSKGTVTEDQRIHLGNDGNGYFCVLQSDEVLQ